jgi:hypothetical protein
VIRDPFNGSYGNLTLRPAERRRGNVRNKSKSPSRSPRTGLGSGARCTATPPGGTERRRMPNTCAWHRRGWLENCRCRLKLTPRTVADSARKTLQEHPRSCKASGARPASPLARPHGIAPVTGGEVPSASVSICGILTDTPTDARGATVGDSHKGPLNNQGKPAYFRKNKDANEPKTHAR